MKQEATVRGLGGKLAAELKENFRTKSVGAYLTAVCWLLGAFAWSFTLKITKAYTNNSGGTSDSGTVSVTVGNFIQAADVSGNFGTIADGDYTFTIGTSYRFTVYCETTTPNQFVQLNLRQTAGSGFDAEISDAQIIYYPETSKTNGNILYAVDFMKDLAPAAAAIRLPVAMLPARKDF